MSKEERKTIKELKNTKDIIIVQANDGCKIVVIDKEEYVLIIKEK